MNVTMDQLCADMAALRAKPSVTTQSALNGQAKLCTDSRTVNAGDVFVALPPAVPAERAQKADKRATYIANAVAAGAAVVVCPSRFISGESKVIWVGDEDTRTALGRLLAARYGTSALPFPLIGVTGTNGKTTSVYLLEHLFHSTASKKAGGTGVLGTVSYRWPGHDEAAPLTTPDCATLHQSLAAMRDAAGTSGLAAAIMEVSSHAIDQNRIAGLNFAAVAFTNLTQDHLDYHGDMESYFQAKRRLFAKAPAHDKLMVVNADDPYGLRLLNEFPQASGYALKYRECGDRPFLAGKILADTPEGLRMDLRWRVPQHPEKNADWQLSSPLVGKHNAANLMGVMALALGMGFCPADFACFHNFYGVSGRLERIPLPETPTWARHGKNTGIFVDYAHTPDALIRAQEALRDAGFSRVITVFGCGGDRDRAKRPLMGEAVAAYSDVVVVTSDNPRTENPETIIDDIMPGLARAGAIHRQSDRRKALELAINLVQPGDALLVAGKGHEPYQIIGTVKFPFSDQGILKELLQCV